MSFILNAFLLFFLASFPHFTAALPAPMSKSDLMQKSDIVGTFQVLAVTRVNDVEQFRQTLHAYQAWMQVVSIQKGPMQPRDTFIVTWHDLPLDLLGPWQVGYSTGDLVKSYFVKDPDHPCMYTTTWWNAATVIKTGQQ